MRTEFAQPETWNVLRSDGTTVVHGVTFSMATEKCDWLNTNLSTGLTYEVVCREAGHLACEWIDGMNVHHPAESVPEPVLLRQSDTAEQTSPAVDDRTEGSN